MSAADELLDELGLGVTPADAPPLTRVPMFVRELTQDDLASTTTRANYGSGPGLGIIQKIRYPHHTLARLLAEGKDRVECSAITGYGIEYVSMIQNDPAFKDLVAHYKEQVRQQYLDVHERLATVGTTALEIIQERLSDEDQAKKISIRELKELVESAYDRSIAPSKANGGGFAPGQQPAKTLNIHFGAPAGPVTISETEGPKMIDVTPKPKEPTGV